MSNSSYRINYFLRSHKRDVFIESVKSAVHVSFSLHARPLTTGQLLKSSSDSGTSEPHNALLLRAEYMRVLETFEQLIDEHMMQQDYDLPESRMQALVQTIGKFFTPLPLRAAFMEYDAKFGISARCHVPLSFNEIRCIMNTAQVFAIGSQLRLITFDGDMTLYDDGANFSHDSKLVNLLISLLKISGLNVAIVTAAGYTEAERYEDRLSGLLKGFRQAQLDSNIVNKFWVMGGECNYLFRCNGMFHLSPVPLTYKPEAFHHFQLARLSRHNSLNEMNISSSSPTSGDKSQKHHALPIPVVCMPALATAAVNVRQVTDTPKNPINLIAATNTSLNVDAMPLQKRLVPINDLSEIDADVYSQEEVSALLDVAQKVLEQCQHSMGLPTKVIRKQRAVGIVKVDSSARLSREHLDECVLAVQHSLTLYLRNSSPTNPTSSGTHNSSTKVPLPYCAFNGGQDVWVDIGNKLIGVMILQNLLGIKAEQTLHVGDQFLSTGNDYAARRACSTVWIVNPEETADILVQLTEAILRTPLETNSL